MQKASIHKILDYRPMKLFGLETWLYIVAMVFLIGWGLWTYVTNQDQPEKTSIQKDAGPY